MIIGVLIGLAASAAAILYVLRSTCMDGEQTAVEGTQPNVSAGGGEAKP
jgi:F0F1-type ATP synthase assembly protein I